MRRLLAWTGQVVAWLVILVIATVLLAAVLVPKVAGATPYTVLTGSMQPTYPAGTLVVVKPTPAGDIGVGEAITYQLRSGEPTVVTHRVVAVRIDGAGERTFTTQGDANDTADADPVLPVQVRGKVWYSIPYLGHVNNWLSGKERQMAVYVVAASLLGYAAYMLTSALRDRRREPQEAA